MQNELIKKESPTPAAILQMAVEKGVDINQLKELMDLQERWEKKEAKKAFLDALSRFQSIVPVLKKNKTATINSQRGSFNYKYADLGSITSAIKKTLLDCGLSYRWEFSEQGEKMRVTCFVSHKDGHTESTSMEAGKDDSGAKNMIQQKGSTHTYLQRYTLIGALGLSTADEDNDGRSSISQKKKDEKELSEDEILDQWQQSVNTVNNKTALHALYMKNKKTVDASEKIQAIFKRRQEELKDSKPEAPVNMP